MCSGISAWLCLSLQIKFYQSVHFLALPSPLFLLIAFLLVSYSPFLLPSGQFVITPHRNTVHQTECIIPYSICRGGLYHHCCNSTTSVVSESDHACTGPGTYYSYMQYSCSVYNIIIISYCPGDSFDLGHRWDTKINIFTTWHGVPVQLSISFNNSYLAS